MFNLFKTVMTDPIEVALKEAKEELTEYHLYYVKAKSQGRTDLANGYASRIRYLREVIDDYTIITKDNYGNM